jgi:hypothetical protein
MKQLSLSLCYMACCLIAGQDFAAGLALVRGSVIERQDGRA